MRTRVVAVVVGALLLVAACSGADDDSGDESSSAEGGDASAVADDAGGDGGESAAPARLEGEPLQAGRSVIATGSIQVEVEDLAAAARGARDVAIVHGGYVAAQDADLDARRSSITIRVPGERFDHALDALGALGEVGGRRSTPTT